VLQILGLPFAPESRIYGVLGRTLRDYVSHSEEALTIVRLQQAGFEFALSQLHRFVFQMCKEHRMQNGGKRLLCCLRRNPGLTEENRLMIFSRGALMISSSFPGKQ
jgi:hypothetical protein